MCNAEIVRCYQKLLVIAEKLNFKVVTVNDHVILRKDSWNDVPFDTVAEAYQFLIGFEYGHRAGKKEATQ
jgi:hypothetical protein